MLHGNWHTEGHLVYNKNLSDEDWEGNAARGVFGLGSLQNHVTDDCGEINLRPLNDVFYEIGCLKGEIIPVGSRNKVIGEHTPIELD